MPKPKDNLNLTLDKFVRQDFIGVQDQQSINDFERESEQEFDSYSKPYSP